MIFFNYISCKIALSIVILILGAINFKPFNKISFNNIAIGLVVIIVIICIWIFFDMDIYKKMVLFEFYSKYGVIIE